MFIWLKRSNWQLYLSHRRNNFLRRRRDLRQLTVDTNDAPVAVVPIADQTTDEDAGFSFTVPPTSFIDVDVGDSLTLSATLADGSPLPAWLSFDPVTQTFSGTPLNDDVGALTIRVTATDTSGASATQDFHVTVNNTNDGPVASAAIADQSTNEDAGFSFTVAANSFTDVDVGDTLTLSATLADGSPLPAWLSFDPATQTFSGTPLNGDVGSLTIRVTATDTAGATATQDFTVTVANTNDGPVASAAIADQSTNEDAGFSFTVAARQLYRCRCGRHAHPVGHACRWQPAARLAQLRSGHPDLLRHAAER